MTDDRYKPSIKESLYNWRYSEEHFLTKVALTFKNEFRKVRTLKDCCGHVNEPGC